MRKLFFLFALFLIVVPSIHADVASVDQYDYLAFKKLALEELQSERNFLAEQLDQGGAAPDYFYFLMDDGEKFARQTVVNQLNGIDGLVACLGGSSKDSVKGAMDEIVKSPAATPDGTTGYLDCAESKGVLVKHAAAALAHNSGFAVKDLASAPAPRMFNPVVSSIIELYRTNTVPSDSVFDERVSNTALFAAYQRPTIDEAVVDFVFHEN